MISTEQALQLILCNTVNGNIVEVHPAQALNQVLAASVKSKIHSPGFDQSSMDGYAIRFEDLNTNSLNVIGEVITGNAPQTKMKNGCCLRIFTGAMVPKRADTIVIKENTIYENNSIKILDPLAVRLGANIRLKASQIKKGEEALPEGHIINPASIGYLTMLGMDKIKIYQSPSIAILVTGSELRAPGEKLNPGEIFESNSYTLNAALQSMHLKAKKIVKVKDELKSVERAISKAMEIADIILITGGISAGNYDFVEPALNTVGVKKIFHKVAQKPGRPLYFGVKQNQLFFGLPGNPSSVLSCFYEYVYPALRKLCGFKNYTLPTSKLQLKNVYEKKSPLTHFLKGYASGNQVEILSSQESYLLNSFAKANCLVVIPAEQLIVKENEWVEVHYIDSLNQTAR
ncbi:MAG: gephyrin-like molybdotransferase Glp [Saprospiraceae bacterium]